MPHPAWLTEFHRQWQRARGRSLAPAARPFRRDWEALLDDAGLHSAEDRQAAQRQAEALSRLRLIPFKRRPRFIDKIELPLEHEPWLHQTFGTKDAAALRDQGLAMVESQLRQPHPRHPDLWAGLCATLQAAFQSGKNLPPFSFHHPGEVEGLLALMRAVTARDWPSGTLIRDASTALGHDSKFLESHAAPLSRGLGLLFGEDTPLEALGIQTRHSQLRFSGPLTLHFTDGTSHPTDTLRFETTLTAAELERATHITTPAKRLLTVENQKTTFLQLARADTHRSTLIVASSFPTQAVRLLLEKLPPELPRFHFGDTDPAGWDILRRLREVSPQPVHPHLMVWRPVAESTPLAPRQRAILDRLLADPQMADCHSHLQAMSKANRPGQFEQESLGPPTLGGWPFLTHGCGNECL